MYSSIVSVFLLFLFLEGCTPLPYKSAHREQQALAHTLMNLDTHIPPEEAERLAVDIVYEAERLNRKFERTTDPKFHNFLINIGLKERGLCYHYCDALYLYLHAKSYPSFAFHFVGAHIGSYWREHNALVVTAKGQKVSEGVVIDAWRNPEKLYFSRVKEDHAYSWVHRPDRGCR
jgi:hypothetical protein